MYPWAKKDLLNETSSSFGKRHDRFIRIIECREDEHVCCDESSDLDGPFFFFYATLFKKILVCLPLLIFEKELLTDFNVAPSQLHPNSWALIRAFTILCSQLNISPTLEVFLYFFQVKHSGRKLWVSLNGAPGRALLTLFQYSYKYFKGKFLRIRANKGDPTLLDAFPLYWIPEPRFQSAYCLDDLSPQDQGVREFLANLKVVFDTSFLLNK